jgi:hypothetical protein
MDAAVAALLGGISGAVGSVTATTVTILGSRRANTDAAENERRNRIAEQRLDAYSVAMGHLQEVRMAWWRASQALEQKSDSLDLAALMQHVETPWAAYLGALARLQVLIPANIGEQLSTLSSAVDEMDVAGQNWLRGNRTGKGYYAKREMADDLRRTFTASFAKLIQEI